MKKKILCIILLAVNILLSLAQTMQKHTVQRGETLESVAQKYGVTVAAMKEANPNIGEYFYVGMVLNVPQASQPMQKSVESTDQPVLLKSEDAPVFEPTRNLVPSATATTSTIEQENGFLNSGSDYLVVLRPKDKYYGFHYGGQMSQYIYMAFDAGAGFTKYNSTATITFGLGLGSKYRFGPILLQGSLYPYIGDYSYDVPKDVGSTETKMKQKLAYGAQANLGAGYNIHTGKKKGGKTYLTVGYYMNAFEFETDGMVKNGTWMVGLTTDF